CPPPEAEGVPVPVPPHREAPGQLRHKADS
nr:hypothetical protein [Tanacetum cinerariifolium]